MTDCRWVYRCTTDGEVLATEKREGEKLTEKRENRSASAGSERGETRESEREETRESERGAREEKRLTS